MFAFSIVCCLVGGSLDENAATRSYALCARLSAYIVPAFCVIVTDYFVGKLWLLVLVRSKQWHIVGGQLQMFHLVPLFKLTRPRGNPKRSSKAGSKKRA